MFSKFSSVHDDARKTSVAAVCTFAGGSLDAAAIVAKRIECPDLGSGFEYLSPYATARPSTSVNPDVAVVCASVPLAKSAKDDSVFAKGDLEATESNLDLIPLGPYGSVGTLFSSSGPDQTSYAVTKCARKSISTGKMPRTRRKPFLESSKIKLIVSPALPSSAKPAFSSQRKSPLVGGPKGLRCLSRSLSIWATWTIIVIW